MNRPRLLRIALPTVLMLAAAAAARGQTWTGGISTDWNTAGNWSPTTVPNSPTAAVTFPGGPAGAVNISSSVSAQSLTFTTSTSYYNITSTGGAVLSGVTAITAAGMLAPTIALNSVSTGSLLFPSGSKLTITNDSQGQMAILAGTVIGTSGTGGVIFAGNGVGGTSFDGSFAAAGPGMVTGGLTQTGPGSLDFGGDGSTLSGGLTLNGGELVLDYYFNPASKLNGGALTLSGGLLDFAGNPSISVTPSIPGGTIISGGHTDVEAFIAAAAATLGLGTITRTAGATADFYVSSAYNFTTSAGVTNGLLGTGPAFATFGLGATWATVSGGTIVGLTSFNTDAYSAGTNADVTVSRDLSGGFTTNSMRFNTGSPTLTLSGTNNVIESGGILVTPNATGGTITGGFLSATNNGELIVHQYSASPFTINSALITAVGLTKTGPGTLVLGGDNGNLTGPINVNRGGLTVTTPFAVTSVSSINFNDDRNGDNLQRFTADFGNNSNLAMYAPIQLSAFSATGYGTYFSTGNSTGASVTLGGVISSAPGLTTPIRFVGSTAETSGFNLTNINTFTGNISLLQGFLGINSGSSLGNAANVLTLEAGDADNTGLVFLTSNGIVSQTISLSTNARIVSNGTDSNTISGWITGTGGLFKLGTGTLTLVNSGNTFLGGVTVSGGTLSLGATGGLPARTNVTVGTGAIFTTGTSPNGNFLGTLTLNGGTFRVSAGAITALEASEIVTGPTGGTLDFSGVSLYAVVLFGAGAGITINGNSTWVSPGNATLIYNANMVDMPITIPTGVTLTEGMALATQYGSAFRVTGGGTLFQNSDTTNGSNMNSPLTVVNSQFRLTNASSNGGVGNFGTGAFTLDGGTFSYGGTTATTIKPIALTSNGGTIQVESAATTLTANGAVTGTGGLTKIGSGTLLLGSSGNAFTNLAINAGTVQTANDNTLGAGPVTIGPFGTLNYAGTTTTARTITLNSGTISVAAGQTLTLNGAAIGGGNLYGPGTFALTGNALLSGVTIQNSAAISITGAASLSSISNGGQMTIASSLTSTLVGFTNQGSGSIIVGASSTVNASGFQTYGTLTLIPNTTAAPTILTNTGTTPLFFNGGSQTFIGTPATADPTGQNVVDYLDLHGQNAIVAGGLVVNNGGVFDTVGAGTGTIIAEFGALVKGAGFYQNTVKTQNGGKFQTGNSPGSATFGNFVFGPGGVSNYIFAIDDATGVAGPRPGPSGLVSGWGLIKAVQVALGAATTSGSFTWTATPSNPLTVAIDTLVNPTMVGTDVAGPMAGFDPTQSYSWTAARWTGNYAGPTDAATLDADTSFDTSGVVNPLAGSFGWSLDPADQTLSLVYTPSSVPEPGTLALIGAAAAAGWRRRRAISSR